MECEICGRRLKSAVSLERGIGPGCWKKTHQHEVRGKAQRKEKEPCENEYSIPGQMELEEWIKSMENTEERQ